MGMIAMIDAKKFNIAMGAAIRSLRLKRGMTQGQVGKAIRVSYQQIQKNEHGLNAFSAHQLTLLAPLFGINVADIYVLAKVCDKARNIPQTLTERDGLTAARCVAGIRNKKTRDALIAHLRRFAALEAA